MTYIKTIRCLTIALASAGAFVVPADARERAPQRTALERLAPELRSAKGTVRVDVVLAAQPLARAAQASKRRGALTGRLSRAQLRALRQSKAAGPAIARVNEARRQAALEDLAPAARSTIASQARVAQTIRRLGGTPLRGNPAFNSISARVPARSLARLSRRPGVASVQPTPDAKPLAGLSLGATFVGAPAFWSAGFEGGRGVNDKNPADIAILADPFDREHPAFVNHTVLTPSYRSELELGNYRHGSLVASAAVSHGASGCARCDADDAQDKGIAPKPDKVLDSSPGYNIAGAEFTWAAGLPFADDFNYHEAGWDILPGASDAAEVMNFSRGEDGLTVDDNILAQMADAVVSTYGATFTAPAGNDGTPKSINSPGIAYNVITAGAAYGLEKPADDSDDSIAEYSSRGPTVAGRKKPDLVASGTVAGADYLWRTADPSMDALWDYNSGTSFAAPQVAGGALLLNGAGITDPKATKALLINSTRMGRATPTSAMGTQTTWQPDWGWGKLDLEAAFAQRTNIDAATVKTGRTRFYRLNGQTTGDRTTLTWHRRVTDCQWLNCMISEPGSVPENMPAGMRTPWKTHTLTNLDLQLVDAATGAVEASSTSAIDNVEQVRAADAGDAILKVKTASAIDGLDAEPYAVASRRPLVPIATPHPDLSVSIEGTLRKPGDTAVVTATLTNPSRDLAADNARLQLELPAGVSRIDGPAADADLGSLATAGTPSATAVVRWTVRADGDANGAIVVTGRGSAIGETFTDTERREVLVDASAPAPRIVAEGREARIIPILVSWGAEDNAGGSGVAHFDVDVSTDDGPWTAWQTATTAATGEFNPRYDGTRYRFRVRATDKFGNTSADAVSDAIAYGTRPPAPEPAQPPGASPPPSKPTLTVPRLRAASLKITKAKLSTRSVTVLGALRAKGRVTVTVTGKRGRETYRAREHVTVADGRWRTAVKLPARLRGARRVTITVAYAGKRGSFAAATLNRVLRRR